MNFANLYVEKKNKEEWKKRKKNTTSDELRHFYVTLWISLKRYCTIYRVLTAKIVCYNVNEKFDRPYLLLDISPNIKRKKN